MVHPWAGDANSVAGLGHGIPHEAARIPHLRAGPLMNAVDGAANGDLFYWSF